MADTYNMSDVMISYSRKDKPFVQRLESSLRAAGREVWVDWEDIPTGVDFMQEIFAGIEAANTFIFIISPDSVSSPVCLEEVRHAVLHHKRFVPILHRDIDNTSKDSFHAALSAHNWLFFRESDSYDEAFGLLLKTLDTDLAHVRYHTRLLVRAREWEDKARSSSLLLRGDDLRDAETWLMRSANQQPPPTDLQREYILASRRGTQARNRIFAGVGAALLVITLLALFAFSQSVIAQREADNAATQAAIALNNAATATIAQGEAVAQAGTAAAAALIARNAQATSDYNAAIAATAAANEALARSTSEANANLAATQAALADIARSTSDANAIVAVNNAVTATFAQGEAVAQAGTAAAAALIARNAQATSDYSAEIAATAAANEALARLTSEANADLAATQAALAEVARATSDANALVARQNAEAANVAQGEAELQAATAAAAAVFARSAQATSDYSAAIAATAAVNEALARSTSDANAVIALNNAATATVAQGQAVVQADIAAAAALEAQNARATSDYNAEAAAIQAQLAVNARATSEANAAAASTAAANEALARSTSEANANLAATAAAAEAIARVTSDYNADVARNNAATARAAQATSDYNAFVAATAAANESFARATSEANATFAVAAQETVIAVNVTAAAAAQVEANLQATVAAAEAARARGLALSDSAEQIYETGNSDLALLMALEANAADATLAEAYRALVRLSFLTGTRQVFGRADGQQHTGAVTSIAYSPDGATLVSAGADGAVKLWDAASGTLIREFGQGGDRHTSGVNVVLFTPDGANVISGDDDGDIIRWDAATGALVRRFGTASGYEKIGPIRSLALRADGTVLSTNGTNIIAWNGATGQLAGRNNISAAAIVGHNLALNGNNAYLILGGTAYGGSNISARQFGFADGWISVFGPTNDRLLMTPSEDASYFLLRSIATRGDVRRYDGHIGKITSLIYSPDGRYALSGGGGGNAPKPDYSIILWDVETGAIINHYRGHTAAVSALTFRPDGQQFISASEDGEIRLWDVLPNSDLARFDNLASPVRLMAFAPDGQSLALAYDNQALVLVDPATGAMIKNLPGQPNTFTNMVYSHDGQTLVSADENGSIMVWDMVSQRQRGQRLSAGDTDAYIALSPDGGTIYAGTGDGIIRLWDAAANGQVRARWNSGLGRVRALALSPDGSTLVSAHARAVGTTLLIWDTASGSPGARMNAGEVNRIIFSRDGQNILINASNTVEFINLTTGDRRLFGSGGGAHDSAVTDVAFSPDGTAALTASRDDVRLWDVASGRLIYTYRPGATALAYTPDGAAFAAASPDLTLSFFRVGSRQQVVAWVNTNRFVRELSCDERDQYDITPLCTSAARALTPSPTPETGVIIAGQHINVRSGPTDTAKPVTSAAPRTSVTVLSRVPGWVEVLLPDGRSGWVVEQFVGAP